MGDKAVTGAPARSEASGVGEVRAAPTTARPARFWAGIVVVVLSAALAVMWTLIARRELAVSVIASRSAHAARVRAMYDTMRAQTLTVLQSQGRLLVEDPRLKATLATEDMDAATVDDILRDLGALRGHGFFMVLTPEGKVFAESGAKELRGLDLSSSSVVRDAAGSPTGAVGAWAIDGKVIGLSILAIRYGEDLIAYLVVGQALDVSDVQSLAAQCGCEVATSLGTQLIAASSTDAGLTAMFTRLATTGGAVSGRIEDADGHPYVTAVFDLGDVAQAHRLLVADPVERAEAPFDRMRMLLWAPAGLVLVAVLFALSANRSPRRTS
jgi:hypothetical protein